MYGYDISNFMTWFIDCCISIFGSFFTTLESIQFLGTNLLQVSITIILLGTLLPVLLTIANSQGLGRVERSISERSRKKENNDKK